LVARQGESCYQREAAKQRERWQEEMGKQREGERGRAGEGASEKESREQSREQSRGQRAEQGGAAKQRERWQEEMGKQREGERGREGEGASEKESREQRAEQRAEGRAEKGCQAERALARGDGQAESVPASKERVLGKQGTCWRWQVEECWHVANIQGFLRVQILKWELPVRKCAIVLPLHLIFTIRIVYFYNLAVLRGIVAANRAVATASSLSRVRRCSQRLWRPFGASIAVLLRKILSCHCLQRAEKRRAKN
jgi:hypothetical protein